MKGFTGKERDPETGLDYFGARYDMSAVGRWAAADPLGEKHPEWSPYNYVLDNPPALLDPDGRQVAGNLVDTRVGITAGAVAAGVPAWSFATAEERWQGAPALVRWLVNPFRAASDAMSDQPVGEAFASSVMFLGAPLETVGQAFVPSEMVGAASVRELRQAGLRDAHHVIQDAAVRDLPGYSSIEAPGVQLPGPASSPGSPHYLATQVQRQAGGGTFGAERRIGYKALRKAGFSEGTARAIMAKVDDFFAKLGVGRDTPTRIPGNRQN